MLLFDLHCLLIVFISPRCSFIDRAKQQTVKASKNMIIIIAIAETANIL